MLGLFFECDSEKQNNKAREELHARTTPQGIHNTYVLRQREGGRECASRRRASRASDDAEGRKRRELKRVTLLEKKNNIEGTPHAKCRWVATFRPSGRCSCWRHC
jgi:hypothetical protein